MKPDSAYCPNFDFMVFRRTHLQVEIVRLRCKSWSCEYCAKFNRDMWRSHLKKRIGKMGGTWWFVTITAHEWNRGAAETLKNLQRGIDLLFKRVRRVWGKVEYVRVYEKHKTGAFHAHLIINGLSDFVAYRRARSGAKTFAPVESKGERVLSCKTWFSRAARACQMGYRVDVQKLDGVQKTVNYVCKYMTKEAQAFTEKGLRRIQASQGIGAANARHKPRGWQAVKYIYAADAAGQPVRDLDLKMTINPSWWRENFTYPPSAQA